MQDFLNIMAGEMLYKTNWNPQWLVQYFQFMIVFYGNNLFSQYLSYFLKNA